MIVTNTSAIYEPNFPINYVRWLMGALLLILSLGFGANHSHAIDSIKIEYCSDRLAGADISDALACRYVLKKELPAASLAASTTWIRLSIPPKFSSNGKVIVQIAPHFVGKIGLFELQNNHWRLTSAGSTFAFNRGFAGIGGYTFIASTNLTAETNIFVRIQQPGLGLIAIDVFDLDQNQIRNFSPDLGIGIHVGILLLLCAISLANYFIYPGALTFRFACLMFNALLCMLGGSGILAKYVFAELPQIDTLFFNVMVCIRLAAWVWVSDAFLLSFERPNWYRWCCNIVYAIVVIAITLVFFDKIVLLQLILLVGFSLIVVTQIIAIQFTPGIQAYFRRVLFGGFFTVGLLTMLVVGLASYPFESSTYVIQITRIIDFVVPTVLLLVVAVRNRLTAKQFSDVKAANSEISLRLDFERKLLNERRVLLDMLSHELKNPLATISMAIGSLKDSLMGEQEKRRLHNMHQSVLSMDSIIERCQLMNRIDNHELSPISEPVSLSECVRQVIAQQNSFNRIQLELNRDICVKSDPELLKIVLKNLIENAFKYSPPNSIVTVKVFLSNTNELTTACFVVRNMIKMHHTPDVVRIFERFYRGPSDTITSGSGLGLFIVSELCQLLQANVTCQLRDEFMEFWVALPLDDQTGAVRCD